MEDEFPFASRPITDDASTHHPLPQMPLLTFDEDDSTWNHDRDATTEERASCDDLIEPTAPTDTTNEDRGARPQPTLKTH